MKIDLKVKAETKEIVLNALQLEVHAAKVIGKDGKGPRHFYQALLTLIDSRPYCNEDCC